jgi:hypothetical protein
MSRLPGRFLPARLPGCRLIAGHSPDKQQGPLAKADPVNAHVESVVRRMVKLHHDSVSGLQHAPDPPRWPSNGVSPYGPQRRPGTGMDPAEIERRQAARNGSPACLRVPRLSVPTVKHVKPASYAGERCGAVGASGSERPRQRAPWEHVNNSADDLDLTVNPEDLRRRARLALRAAGRRVSRLKSRPRDGSEPQYTLRKCGAVRISESGNVRLKLVGNTGYAEGVVHCGSIWGCAVCAAKIRNGRAQIYGESAARWIAAGNTIMMITLTAPHSAGMALDPFWDLISKGVSRLTSSAGWRDLKAELGGEVYYRRAIEVTHGSNGWHVHCHLLIYIRGDAGAAGLAAVDAYFRHCWPKWITSQDDPATGKPRKVPNRHGVDVKPCHAGDSAAEYIVKTQDGGGVGNELIRADLKTGRSSGRTPFEILGSADHGVKRDLALWWEWEQASQGRRAITQSQGLADVLGENDLTDQELADEEAGGEAVADVPGESWDQVIRQQIEAEVFEAARGGLGAVNAVLARHGIGLAYVPVITERGS